MFRKLLFLFTLLALTIPPSGWTKVLHSEKSLYQNIIIDEVKGQRCLKFTKRRKARNQSCYSLNEPKRLVFTYTKLMMGSLLLQQNPKDILVVGLGAGTLPSTFKELLPKANITSVEIDEVIVRLAKEFFDFTPNENNSVITLDARVYVKRAIAREKGYDLIVLDAFGADYIPEHLMTLEFFNELKRLLKPSGIVASNTFANSRLQAYETETYLKAFGAIIVAKSDVSNNRIIYAAKTSDVLDEAASKIANRLSHFEPRLKPYGVSANWIASTLRKISRPANKGLILTDQFSPINILNAQ